MSETVEINDLYTILTRLMSRVEFLETRSLYSKTPIRVPQLTTTERDALDAENGDLIYNTTNNRIEAYENGSWVDL